MSGCPPSCNRIARQTEISLPLRNHRQGACEISSRSFETAEHCRYRKWHPRIMKNSQSSFSRISCDKCWQGTWHLTFPLSSTFSTKMRAFLKSGRRLWVKSKKLAVVRVEPVRDADSRRRWRIVRPRLQPNARNRQSRGAARHYPCPVNSRRTSTRTPWSDSSTNMGLTRLHSASRRSTRGHSLQHSSCWVHALQYPAQKHEHRLWDQRAVHWRPVAGRQSRAWRLEHGRRTRIQLSESRPTRIRARIAIRIASDLAIIGGGRHLIQRGLQQQNTMSEVMQIFAVRSNLSHLLNDLKVIDWHRIKRNSDILNTITQDGGPTDIKIIHIEYAVNPQKFTPTTQLQHLGIAIRGLILRE